MSELEIAARRGVLLGVFVLGVLAASAVTAPSQTSAAGPSSEVIGTCTIAVAERRATIEVRVANASDFCELMSQALAAAVFRSPVLFTPGWLWHYAGSVPSCHLRYRRTPYRMTVRNSAHACRWLVRRATGWNAETQPRNERS